MHLTNCEYLDRWIYALFIDIDGALSGSLEVLFASIGQILPRRHEEGQR